MQNAQANRRSEPAGGSLPRRWCADITLDFLKRPAEILEHARPQDAVPQAGSQLAADTSLNTS